MTETINEHALCLRLEKLSHGLPKDIKEQLRQPITTRLTREQAIKNHRKMWQWIRAQTLRQKRCVNEQDYFTANNFSFESIPLAKSYLCEYNRECNRGNSCKNCPVLWNGLDCCSKESSLDMQGLYTKWKDAVNKKDFYTAAELAGIIAELPQSYTERRLRA